MKPYNSLLSGKYIFVWLISILLQPLSGMAANHDYAAESVLASGKWVKIHVEESGVYQLTRTALSRLGFSDMAKVKIYGYGGAMISETMGDGYIDDLPQLPVYNDGDKIVFYAQGPVSWEYSGASMVRHERNPYSVAGYYFITENEGENVIQTTGEPSAGNGRPLITTTVATFLHENELYAPATTGRSLFGEDFRYNTVQTFPFSLPGRVENTAVSVRVNFFANTSGRSSLDVVAENETVASLSLSATTGSYSIGTMGSCSGNTVAGDDNLSLTLRYSSSGSISFAYLDYIELNYRKSLALSNGSVEFRSYSSECRDSVFSVSGCNDGVVVWDITDKHKPLSVETVMEGTELRFRQTETGRREYVAFNPAATFPAPFVDGAVENQNLHGAETPTMLILTPSEFISEAQRLANFHEEHDSMRVLVVDHKKVFNEFSSGTPDAMAYRKIAKMFWERTKNLPDSSNSKFRYMILFGRSLFDNRQLSAAAKSVTYPLLLTWESDNSLSQSDGFNSDDIFGTLEDGTDFSGKYENLDIALGRMPVKSVAEAGDVVDKIINFVTNPDPGSWKNNVLMIADDGDSGTHMDCSEEAIVNMQNNGGGCYVYNRVYIDAFERSSEGTGTTYPEAREKMLREFRSGAIYASYLGHANPTSWTHNGLLRWEDIQNEFYYKHLPLLYTGTCEFTRWDDFDVSGGELLFLNPRGGVIGLITSSRATGIGANGYLAEALGNYVFQPDKYGGMRRMGDVVKDAKNSRNGDDGHRWKYVLIGDPAVRLKYPEYRVVVDDINGQQLDDNADAYPELKARQTVTFRGHIEDLDGKPIDNIDGELYSTVYDSQESVTTHGYAEGSDEGKELTYDEWNNKLYQGIDSINGGRFEVTFRIPKETNDNYRPGLISLYAYSDDGIDGNGLTDKFYVYGYDDSGEEDNQAPEITLFALNSEEFKDGDSVNETPYLIARIYDDSGINLSEAGIGHGITLLLDGKTTISGLSSYYSQDVSKNGYINYQMDELEEGWHTLRLRVWDTDGNMAEKTISFNVVKGLAPQLYEVYSDANPAKTEANFYLRHNRPDAMVTVTISVYTMMGQEVWSNTSTGRSDMYLSMPVTWNLTDGSGRRVNRGIYLYRASVSTDGFNETTKAQRIAVAGE